MKTGVFMKKRKIKRKDIKGNSELEKIKLKSWLVFVPLSSNIDVATKLGYQIQEITASSSE